MSEKVLYSMYIALAGSADRSLARDPHGD